MKIHTLAFLLLMLSLFACKEPLDVLASTAVADIEQKPKSNKPEGPNIILKSSDGGQTWQDISEGLPENLQGEDFFAADSGLYLMSKNQIYHSKPNATAPFWNQKLFPEERSSTATGKTGIYAFNFNGRFLQNINGRPEWAPRFANFPTEEIRSVFETAGGTVFIGSEIGLYKSANNRQTWKMVQSGRWGFQVAESNGILIATSREGIIRSTDNGENWDTVISDGGHGMDVERIDGGFAAITYDPRTQARKVRASYDGGKTWQAIDAGLPSSPFGISIIRVGDNLFCGHTAGIYRSTDKGKTWKLILPSIGEKVYHLTVSGNVIYVMPTVRGC